MAASKDVTKKGEEPGTDLTTTDYGSDAGRGFEHQSNSDIAIPFINVLQALSPQLDGEGAVPGAKQGMFFNTVTQKLTEGKVGILFVPGTTRQQFIEWVPRAHGGGFVAAHLPNSEVVRVAKSKAHETGGSLKVGDNELMETFYMYGVLSSEDGEVLGMAVIPFTSTKIKAYKNLNTTLRSFMLPLADGRKINPPLFANLVRFTTFKTKNSKGEFYAVTAAPAQGDVSKSLLRTNDPRFLAAKECAQLVDSGVAQADYASVAESDPDDDGKIPF